MLSSLRNLAVLALIVLASPAAMAQYAPLPDTPLHVDGEWTEGFDLPGLSSPVS